MMKKILFPIIIVMIILVIFAGGNKDKEKTVPLTSLLVWGMDDDGQVGKNLERIINPQQVMAGKDHSMALDAEGNIWTWGSNEHSQLGRVIDNEIDQEAEVVNLLGSSAKSISSTHEHSVILDVDGHVWTFGSNFTGQLGDNGNKDSMTPYKIPNLENIVAVASGNKFSLAIDKNGDVFGWGASCSDENKKITLDMLNKAADPKAHTNEDGEGNYYNSKSTGEGSYEHGEDCLNENTIGILSKIPRKLEGLENIVDISAGYGHALLLDENGDVWSFGCNLYGQLGRGNFDNSNANSKPQKIAGLQKIKAISAGFRHSIALDDNGNAYAWGINTKVEKDGNTFNNATPDKIDSLENIEKIVAGRDYSLAINDKGGLYGWGNDTFGLLQTEKNSFINKPLLISRTKSINVIDMRAGLAHIVAIVK